MDQVTVDSILEWMQTQVEEKQSIPPSVWVDAAAKLNVLLGAEHDRFVELQQEVAKIKLAHLQSQEKRNVSEANLFTEASREWADMKRQEYKINRIEEFIRTAKLRGRMTEAEMRSY